MLSSLRKITILVIGVLSLGAGFQHPSVAGPLVRKPWTSSRLTGSPEPPAPFRVEQVFGKLKFNQPVDMTRLPGSDRLFVVEQAGRIFSFPARGDVERADLFLDLKRDLKTLDANPQAKEVLSVYGLVFHPRFAENGFCFVTYALSAKEGGQLKDGARLSRFKVTGLDPPRCDPASEEVIITWLEGGHMGSAVAFGPDGMLYLSTGDAGPAAPPDQLATGQGVDDLLSCILRIDVDHREEDRAYRIPPDNPFVGIEGARGEIWAYGFRNPWKMSFDRQTGDLWVGDVGWETWELVYRVERGGNYGWSIMEGPLRVRDDVRLGPTPIVPPDDVLPHSISASITGGYVYRGKRFPELVGTYIYGDWETRRIWSARVEASTGAEGRRTVKLAPRRDLTDAAIRLVTFAEDNDGELYLVDYDLGTIHQLARNHAVDQSKTFPRKLSETGLFDSVADHRPASGVVPFSVNAEQWVDGATFERLVAVPGTASIELFSQPEPTPGSMFNRVMSFPKDTAFVRTLSLDLTAGDAKSRRRIETQVLHFDGREMRAYTYAWNDEQSDAELVAAAGDEKNFAVIDAAAPGGKRTQLWTYYGRAQCLQCHNPWAHHTLAFNTLQLNREHEYDGVRRNQVEALRELQILLSHANLRTERTLNNAGSIERLVDPHDASVDLATRARSYLHVNCAHCHRFGGGGSANIELKHDQPLEKNKGLLASPVRGTFGIADAAIVAPGEPYRSILYYRMAKTGRGRMPHLGAEVVDERGLRLVHDWILGLSPTTQASGSLEKLRLLDAEPASEEQLARRKQAIDNLLSSTRDSLVLARSVGEKEFSAPLRDEVVAAASRHSDATIRDLFERFLPDSQRQGRLGNRIKPQQILALHGNAERGRSLFFGTASLQCKSCHRVKDEGGKVGPELTAVGKKLTREQILENIAEPSKTIAQEYRTHLFETSDGKALSGIIVSKTENELVLRDAEDKEVRLAVAEIEQMAPQPLSMMPEGLLRDLTAQQAADLVEYLYSLK
jgi:putative heme-binding domain-containing protein